MEAYNFPYVFKSSASLLISEISSHVFLAIVQTGVNASNSLKIPLVCNHPTNSPFRNV